MRSRFPYKIGVTALLAMATLVIGMAQVAKEPSERFPSIKKLMSQAQFNQAGLTKLSDVELRALDIWLYAYAREVANAALPKAATNQDEDVIETRINGAFEGWDGDTIWKMTNGQIWQQAAYAYHYHFAFQPRVTIFKSGSSYRMKVEGVSGEVTIKRIK